MKQTQLNELGVISKHFNVQNFGIEFFLLRYRGMYRLGYRRVQAAFIFVSYHVPIKSKSIALKHILSSALR